MQHPTIAQERCIETHRHPHTMPNTIPRRVPDARAAVRTLHRRAAYAPLRSRAAVARLSRLARVAEGVRPVSRLAAPALRPGVALS